MLQEIVIKLELDSTSSTGVRLCLGEISSEELYRVCREAAHVRTSVCAAAGQCPRARCVSPQPRCARHSDSTEPAPQGSGWEWGKRRARDCSGARAGRFSACFASLPRHGPRQQRGCSCTEAKHPPCVRASGISESAQSLKRLQTN